MQITCGGKCCGNVLALRFGATTGTVYGHRSYGFAHALAIQCEACGRTWQSKGFDARRDLRPNPIYALVRCPCGDCRGNVLGQIASDHVLLRHEGRVTICTGLSYVSCDRCRRGYDVAVAPGLTPCAAPIVTLTASD